jgi:hypothetical protein
VRFLLVCDVLVVYLRGTLWIHDRAPKVFAGGFTQSKGNHKIPAHAQIRRNGQIRTAARMSDHTHILLFAHAATSRRECGRWWQIPFSWSQVGGGGCIRTHTRFIGLPRSRSSYRFYHRARSHLGRVFVRSTNSTASFSKWLCS